MLNKRTAIAGIMSAMLIVFSPNLIASGGGGYSSEPAKPVDQAYETGKSIFFGRINGERITYCIVDSNNASDKPIVVKRRTMKKLKGLEYSQVAERLYNCKKPSESMTSLLTKGQVNSVMYYLNKRYRLSLIRN